MLRIGHFIFITNFKGDPYELADRLLWQIEEARIRYVRRLKNRVFLFLHYS
jgi:putative transposase